MNLFSYRLHHDLGLAPNPFGEYCTLAVCKPDIRKNKHLNIGDWVIGTGSVELQNEDHLIYAMKVNEIIPFQRYWEDHRFQYKKPSVRKGSLVKMHGDNIYHFDEAKEKWIQENSAHSKDAGLVNCKHMKSDLEGENVLIATHFYYFGDEAPLIPDKLKGVIKQKQGFKFRIPELLRDQFLAWLQNNYDYGMHGFPVSWKRNYRF